MNAVEDCERLSMWVLPAGAESIIKQIAAEHLLCHLLEGRLSSCSKPVDFEAVGHIVEEYPEICRRSFEWQWEGGDTRILYPLAMICLLRPPLDLVKLIYRAYPEALTIAEPTKGCIPLHYACSAEASLDIVAFLLSEKPDSIHTPRKDGMLPLHLASYFKAPLQIVDFLLSTYPRAISMVDKEDWTPLHAAARGNAKRSVVERLYDMHPQSTLWVDDTRRTPLHLACMKRGDEDVVAFLCDCAPHALRMEDTNSLTPIFHAAKCQSVPAILVLLARMPPGDPPPVDHLGATLLHFAVAANTPDVVEFFCQTFPEMASARSTERMRYTPLHVACLCDAPVENVKMLLKYFPESIFVNTGQGHDCVKVARKSKASQVLIDYLEHELFTRTLRNFHLYTNCEQNS